jgi:hypothetical protein
MTPIGVEPSAEPLQRSLGERFEVIVHAVERNAS